MIPWSEALAGGVMGFFGSLPVAGPVALVVITKGLNRDGAGARAVALGAGLAEGLLAGVVFAGMGWIVSGSPRVADALDWAGIFVLFGVGAWFAVRGLGAPRSYGEADDEGRERLTRGLFVGGGMVLGNPGMLGTWSGAVAALEGTGLVVARTQSAFAFGCGVAIGVIAWFWLLLAAIKRWSGVLSGKTLDSGVRIMGLALIATGTFAVFRMLGD